MLSNKPWETAAGVLVAREAGALVVDRYGEPHTARSTSTIALVPAVRDELMQLLAE
jgi:myo-inositol-1(or 4)-monophosphatase